MPRETTNQGKLGRLQKLRDALNANSESLTHLEGSRTEFDDMVEEALELARQQGALTAEKQDVAKHFRMTLTEAERLATVLRFAVKQHFGISSEKLTEFDLQPFRGRRRLEPLPPPPIEMSL